MVSSTAVQYAGNRRLKRDSAKSRTERERPTEKKITKPLIMKNSSTPKYPKYSCGTWWNGVRATSRGYMEV
jgi:hypothetical protein